MPGRARRHKDGRNRRGNRSATVRKGLSRSRRAARAGDLYGYAGTLCTDTGRTFSAQRKKDFFRRERACTVLTDTLMSDWPLSFRVRFLITRVLKAIGPSHTRAHKHSSRHRGEIERSERCGCFYCLETFVPRDIRDWTDDGATAICPRCGIDSVIGSASGFSLSKKFLRRMHSYWFERSYPIKA